MIRPRHYKHRKLLGRPYIQGPFLLDNFNPEIGFAQVNIISLGPQHPAGHSALEAWHRVGVSCALGQHSSSKWLVAATSDTRS